jgi:hypothetical protein
MSQVSSTPTQLISAMGYTVKDVQQLLLQKGFNLDPWGADGDIGPTTLGQMMLALKQLPDKVTIPAPPPLSPQNVVPRDWMPWARMNKIIVHWTAGGWQASGLDLEHYHILIEVDATLERGKYTILDNESANDNIYAAHTKGCNTGAIGVSLCGMLNARESPFDAGKFPITKAQWDFLPRVLSDLCRRYAITPHRTTVLSHAEVQQTLGIKQNGKWDIARLPWDPNIRGAIAIGDAFRKATTEYLQAA